MHENKDDLIRAESSERRLGDSEKCGVGKVMELPGSGWGGNYEASFQSPT
jgi:hypothetical protein